MGTRSCAGLVVACLLAGCGSSPPALWEQRLVDLTHTFDAQTIYWPTEKGFELSAGTAGMTEGGYYYAAHSLRTAEHGGTHMDAPIHFYEGRDTADQVPLHRLVGPGVVVDVSEAAAADPNYQVGVADFAAWEQEHGALPEGAIVLLRTGFGRFWPDRERYLGTAERGAEAVAKLQFPGLDPDAVPWLAERGIAAIGLDTASIDHGPSVTFQAHVDLFERNIPAFENVANLEQLPARGFTIVALPMKVGGGSGGPLRIIAALPPS